jgi:hypothetical protein
MKNKIIAYAALGAAMILLHWNLYNVHQIEEWNNHEDEYLATISYKTESLYVGLNLNHRTIPVQLEPNNYMRAQVGAIYPVRLSRLEMGQGKESPVFGGFFVALLIVFYVLLTAAVISNIIKSKENGNNK